MELMGRIRRGAASPTRAVPDSLSDGGCCAPGHCTCQAQVSAETKYLKSEEYFALILLDNKIAHKF